MNPTSPKKQVQIRELREAGYSLRQIVSIAGVSKEIAAKYSEGVVAHCECGRPTTHKEWCKFRFARSERRQEMLHPTGKDRDSLPGLYVQRECPVCHEGIELGMRHRRCAILVADTERLMYEVEEKIKNGKE